ncbi:hypothetical protein PAGA_a3498 [Pseudoalteromonas agarivorans DSM 14585]|uniref:Uncharacterized protein n=1 Tax=Pseudoalteromonas agarivorans DSM 14585 TaxID=1312369 RepID=A0ACA8E0B6_9GAMM|nr:hypothetical protein PAGA_a3498 [Pseudoalteromonas agarivorans DSM 14585]
MSFNRGIKVASLYDNFMALGAIDLSGLNLLNLGAVQSKR